MVMIDQRPAEAESKQVAGHWKGDLIVGPGSVSAMVTLRKRKTHYRMVINLPTDHTAASVNHAIITAFASLPPKLKRSLTWDQGVEMASHEALTAATGIPVYFAERSSPWQRGANENFNGLLRQYFPQRHRPRRTQPRPRCIRRRRTQQPTPELLDYDTPAARLRAEHRTPAATLRWPSNT